MKTRQAGRGTARQDMRQLQSHGAVTERVIQPQLAGRGKQGAPAEVIGGKFHAKGKQLPAATRQNNYT